MAILGNSTADANTDQFPASTPYVFCWGPYTMTENGTLVDFNVRVQGVGGADYQLYCGLWNDSSNYPGSRFAYSGIITVTLGAAMQWWNNTSITGSTALVSGNKYWIGCSSNNNPGSGNNFQVKTTGATFTNKFIAGSLGIPPDPFPGSATSQTEDGDIYVTYTPSGPPGIRPQMQRFPKTIMRR